MLFKDDICLHTDDYIELHTYLCDCLFEQGDGEKTIDYVRDYPYIWDSFKSERGIDLNKDDVHWWEFTTILECLLMNGNNSISKVMEYRFYKKPSKNAEKEHHSFMLKMKDKFKLIYSEEEREIKVQSGLKKMYNYFKRKE